MFIFLQQPTKKPSSVVHTTFFRQLTDSQIIGQSYRRHTNNTILHLDREKSKITSCAASQQQKIYTLFLQSTVQIFIHEATVFLYTLFTHTCNKSLFFPLIQSTFLFYRSNKSSKNYSLGMNEEKKY